MKADAIDSESILARLLAADTVQRGNAALILVLAFYFFFIPGVLYVHHLQDPNLAGPGIPKLAWAMHRNLAPKYEKWARDRVASGVAARLPLYDVPSTEWPIFGSVYFLWATEALQDAWKKDPSLAPVAPAQYAGPAVDACIDLILDPNHHSWVKEHWGPDYMHRENVFFRSLVIAGITSHAAITGSEKHLDLLRDQATTLAADLDGSPFGVLNDYPYECYPIDVFVASALIQRAQRRLGLDPQPFVSREIRAFEGRMLDERGLIPYFMYASTGKQEGPSRGVGNAWVSMFAPELYPTRARDWYDRSVKHFWQDGWCAGFREFPKDIPNKDWLFDVDAGPIMAGYGPAANAFGYAAARINGRLDQADTLGAQVLAASWPLPDGRLLGARILSISPHAPYLGEAAIFYFLTRTPAPGVEIRTGGHWPKLVWIMMIFYFGMGLGGVAAVIVRLRRWKREREEVVVLLEPVQAALWWLLIGTAATLFILGRNESGMVAILLAILLPRTTRCRCSLMRQKAIASSGHS